VPSRIIFFAVEQHPFQDNIRYATILDQRFYSLVREYGALNFRKPPDLTKLLASWSTTGMKKALLDAACCGGIYAIGFGDSELLCCRVVLRCINVPRERRLTHFPTFQQH